MCHHQINTFLAATKYQWDIKKDAGKSMKKALYEQRYGKGISQH